MSSVAVIDIGSNSIKVLVAARDSNGALVVQRMRTIDARIGAGISQTHPTLSADGMERGVAAVQELLGEAAAFSPAKTLLVATSAVRDAANGAEFSERVRATCGHSLRILSGDEEANLIGRGLTCDPALSSFKDFYVFDLGGGSLECLAFRARRIQQALSLQLGCVRLTELCVADTTSPFSSGAHSRVAELTKDVFAKSGFHFDLPPDAPAIGTGGTLTTARAIIAARTGRRMEETDTILTVDQLRELLAYVGWFSLEERRRVPGLPAARADVFPAALATVIAVAEIGGIHAFRNSLYNLRWGLAAEALDDLA